MNSTPKLRGIGIPHETQLDTSLHDTPKYILPTSNAPYTSELKHILQEIFHVESKL